MKSSKTGQELFKTIRALFKTAQLFEEALFEWPETETGNLKKPEEETSDKKKTIAAKIFERLQRFLPQAGSPKKAV